MKKGRHRRFEEARAQKRQLLTNELSLSEEPCPECGAEPGDPHATWCLATEDDEELDEGQENTPGAP